MDYQDSEILPFDERFTKFDDANRAGLAVMVIDNGVIRFKKGYGLRNIETQEKVDCDTNFRMASVSKQFTAMCAAILEERKVISDEDPIGKFLPELPAYTKGIKIKHLIHHTSGLPNYARELWSSDKSKPMINNHDIYDWYKKQSRTTYFQAREYGEFIGHHVSLSGQEPIFMLHRLAFL